MSKVLTTASKCVPNLITLSSKTSTINARSSSPIHRSYSIQHTRYTSSLSHNIRSRQPTQISSINQSRLLQLNNLIYYDPLFTFKRGNASQPKGFLGSLMDNIKEEFTKNKEIKVKQK
ncbi:unnamed protein product [Rotaria magnacalcarata]|uniref:Uncharacterized protein n=1 Tax=Rotaria magnacalcarata TaxID=392030 RepID=A0A8S3J705_9BILA|nr:unnamed protein product [Rotaria magnacalcarata]